MDDIGWGGEPFQRIRVWLVRRRGCVASVFGAEGGDVGWEGSQCELQYVVNGSNELSQPLAVSYEYENGHVKTHLPNLVIMLPENRIFPPTPHRLLSQLPPYTAIGIPDDLVQITSSCRLRVARTAAGKRVRVDELEVGISSTTQVEGCGGADRAGPAYDEDAIHTRRSTAGQGEVL
jgi:hypothetical protein